MIRAMSVLVSLGLVSLGLAAPAFGQAPAEPAPAEPVPPAEPAPAEPAPEQPAAEPAPEAPAPEAPAPEVPAEPSLASPADPGAPAPEPAAADVGAPEKAARAPASGYRRFAVSAEAASIVAADPAFDLFSGGGNVIGSGGLSIGVRPVRNVAIVASWQALRRGAEVSAADESSETFVAAFTGHEFTAGLKADVGIADVLRPYLSAQGVALPARVRFDDDPTDADSPGQVSARGLFAGGMFMGGVELRAPPASPVQVAWYLEMGDTVLTRATFGDLGGFGMGGFSVRSGLGVRF